MYRTPTESSSGAIRSAKSCSGPDRPAQRSRLEALGLSGGRAAQGRAGLLRAAAAARQAPSCARSRPVLLACGDASDCRGEIAECPTGLRLPRLAPPRPALAETSNALEVAFEVWKTAGTGTSPFSSEVLGGQAGVPNEFAQHAGPDLVSIVEGKMK